MSNETKAKTLQRAKPRIKWYRSPVDRESLNEFARKSDLKGFLQAGGHLALLGLTGTFAWLAVGRLAWPWVALIIFGHGTFYAFCLTDCMNSSMRPCSGQSGLIKFFSGFIAFYVGSIRRGSGQAIPSITNIRCTRRMIWKSRYPYRLA